MSKLFSFRYNSSSLRFDLTPWQFQNIVFIPIKTDIRYRLGTVWLVKVGGLREFSMVGGFVLETEKRIGSGLMTSILEAGSTGARIQPMASNKAFPEILIPS